MTSIPMTPAMKAMMEAQRERFFLKFGREPGEHDPVFFDPDADTPQPMRRTAVDVASLNFAQGKIRVMTATVGFARMDRRHTQKIERIFSDFFHAKIKAFCTFDDRATFQIAASTVGAEASVFVDLVEQIRATPPVSFVDLHVIHDEIGYSFECDTPGAAKILFSLDY